MIRRPPRSTLDRSSAASDVYKRQVHEAEHTWPGSRCAHGTACAWEELPQGRILFRRCEAEVLVSARGRHTAARRAIEEACLNEEGLVNVLDRVLLLVNSGGETVDPDRPAVELIDDRSQQLAIHFVEPVLVHLEQLQRVDRHGHRDAALCADLR